MKIQEFIEKFAESIDVFDTESLNAETCFHDLDEWSSISVMLLIAFFDEEFGKEITTADIEQAITIQDLYNFATK